MLVAATGFFALRMTARAYQVYGAAGPSADRALVAIAVLIVVVALVAGFVGLALALGVTRPLEQLTNRLEAVASGDLHAAVSVRSTSEVDSLAGAFNEAVAAINRYIFQSMTGAAITMTTEGIITGASAATEIVLGFREEDLVGRKFSELFAPVDENRKAFSMMQAAIARRQPVSIDALAGAANGRPTRISLEVSYLRPPAASDERATIGVMIALKDLAEIRRLRDQLQQADQLVSLGVLTAGVAHELRNPLAALHGLAELLARDLANSDPRRRYVQTMLDAVGRLNRLVEDLLLLSSPGTATWDPVDLNQVVRDAVTFARLAVADTRVTISVHEASPAPVASGNALRLGQAVGNLLVNAVQATAAGGSVTVTTERSGERSLVRVHNDGSYITADQKKKLFVPFYTTKPSGTGLGLAIARQIATAHGGRIEVESDEVAGTTFSLQLPAATAGAEGVERAS